MNTIIEMFNKSNDIIKKLPDELSKMLYEIRIKNALYHDYDALCDDILNLDVEWHISELDEMFRKHDRVDDIVIFGAGINGRHTAALIKKSKYKDIPLLFCDNNKEMWGKTCCGLPIISPNELYSLHRFGITIVGSSSNRQEIYEQLIFECGLTGYQRDRILYPALNVLFGSTGWQYFDFFSPRDKEVFVDCGCFNGQTSLDFINWTKGNFKKIYAFEADPYSINRCKEIIKDVNKEKILFVEKAVWHRKEMLKFDSRYDGGAKINSNGDALIEADTIDNILNGERVTFIKMDIEGAENNALLGAKNTILKWKPRMAISVYHKPIDILEIPTTILKMDSNYNFALRQYQSNTSETILYAWQD